LSLVVVQFNCASRGRPSGGPVDKITPTILQVFPASDSTGLNELSEIKILFSERMNEASVKQSIFISPPLAYDAIISGGDELILNVEEALQPEQTYVVTIGSGAKDLRNNRMEMSFQLAFSTGSVIDRGNISGTVYGTRSVESFYVYAYRIENRDSLNPIDVRADYLSQPGKNNYFSLDYLAPGDYRVFVVEDQNRNLLLDADYERVGIPYTDVTLDSVNSSYKPLNFFVSRFDTTMPFMTGVRSLNRQILQLRFSEPLQTLDTGQVSITDTLHDDSIEILGISTSKEALNQFLIFCASHDSVAGYKIKVEAVSDTNDISGLPSFLTYIASGQTDTTGFRINGIFPADSSKNQDIRKTIKIQFSKAVKAETVENSFHCWQENGDTLDMNWNWIELREAVLKPLKGFLPGAVYHFELKTEKIVSLWNESLSDTIINRIFFSKSPDEYGSISGIVQAQLDTAADVYVYLRPLRKTEQYRVRTSTDYRFIEPWLPEDNYQVGGYVDLDQNQKLSTGKLVPFSFSEPFNWSTDTIRVRKRWEMSDVFLTIPRGGE
jgi:hypothetical protein